MMTLSFIEHVNITVSSPEKTADMLCHLFGWKIRWQGKAAAGKQSLHIGTKTHYIAVCGNKKNDINGPPLAHAKGQPLNHIGIEVDDLDDVEARATAYGLTPFNHGDYVPGRRFYLFDADGIEWEIISYRP
jgi:catechol 2,3-dioxygenase-like lactoylglutathione lyase family enzyme